MIKNWAVRCMFWSGYWGVGFCLWLLFVNTTKPHELWMGTISACFGASAAELMRGQPFAKFRPRVGWIMQGWREPWYIVEGCCSVFWTFLKHLVKPEKSVLREIVYDAGGVDPESIARRALTIIYSNLQPTSVVLGIDVDKNVMLVHQLSAEKTPAMTRNLGAKS